MFLLDVGESFPGMDRTSLAEFPRVVKAAAELREPHRVARYLEELAGTRAIAAIETCEDPQTLVGTWSTARKARFDYPDETDHVARADSKRKFERAIHLAFLFGYIAAKRAL